jgi:hypothetical protein
MTQDHSGRGRARLKVAAVLMALPLGTAVVSGVAGATPVAAATHAQAAQRQAVDVTPAWAGSTVGDDDRHHHGDRDHRRDCRHEDGGLLGLLVRLLTGPHRCD